MSNPEIIDIKLTTNTSPSTSPKLSVVGNADPGVIRLNNLPPLETTISDKKSVNFGPGVEMLMNPKKQAGGTPRNARIDDLSSIGERLNMVSEGPKRSMADTRAKMMAQAAPAIQLNITEKKVLNLIWILFEKI